MSQTFSLIVCNGAFVRGNGYAQKAIRTAEAVYGSDNWELDTILLEKVNLHLYEKLGYRQTGVVEKINERMDIVHYENREFFIDEANPSRAYVSGGLTDDTYQNCRTCRSKQDLLLV